MKVFVISFYPGKHLKTIVLFVCSNFIIFGKLAGGQKASEINQALIYMICKDNMPLSCVEKTGLRRFMSVICPRYKLPSRATVSNIDEKINIIVPFYFYM